MDDQRGFTLIEVLVALAILGLTIGSIVAIVRNGTEDAADAILLRRATLAAQSVLDRLGQDIPLRNGEIEGDRPDGMTWRLAITPLPGQPAEGRGPLYAHQVVVRVAWMRGGTERHLDFTTLLLEKPQ